MAPTLCTATAEFVIGSLQYVNHLAAYGASGLTANGVSVHPACGLPRESAQDYIRRLLLVSYGCFKAVVTQAPTWHALPNTAKHNPAGST